MSNRRIIGVATLAVGIVLLIMGINASRSVGEQFVEGFTGRFTDRTTWYIVGGIGLIIAGAVLSLSSRRSATD